MAPACRVGLPCRPSRARYRAAPDRLCSLGAARTAAETRGATPQPNAAPPRLSRSRMSAGAASWSFTEDDYGAITDSLQRFLIESQARCALLVDRAGQLVATVGEQPNFDPTAFATLTAADFSANDQLAKLIGENDFNSLFHQGEKESMYLADIARRVILVVLFDNRTTLGLVRLKMKATVEELNQLFTAVFERARDARHSQTGLLAGAEDEIDKMFQ